MEIVKLFVVFDELLESVTVTVMLESPAAEGVPEITPVEEFIVRPLGKVPVALNELVPLPPVVEILSV